MPGVENKTAIIRLMSQKNWWMIHQSGHSNDDSLVDCKRIMLTWKKKGSLIILIRVRDDRSWRITFILLSFSSIETVWKYPKGAWCMLPLVNRLTIT